MSSFTALRVVDVRFPTSRQLDGSDAMNPDPDYSAAYLELVTGDGEVGTAFVFTIGRGNDVQSAAIQALAPHVIGRQVAEVLADPGAFSRELVGDSQLRWLGPEKGVMHMAIGAVVNAAWDLRARRAGQPLWLHLASLSPEEIVDLIDFRYLSDALTRAEALDILRRAEPGREQRIARLRAEGFPAYTTTPGWLGYSDQKLARLLREARAEGFGMVKLKVGGDVEEDERRLAIARAELGEQMPIAIDANQRWDVDVAVSWLDRLAPYHPYWIEEPTSPDDVLGHAAIRRAVAPMRVATGEQVQNRIVAKQLLQAGAIDVLQIDATRVGGVNENLAMLLLAAKFNVPVCPHAGGVGLCETVQHLAMFDAIAVAGTTEGRWIEYVDHLHEHFESPVIIRDGAYVAPETPGGGARMLAASVRDHTYPTGAVWQGQPAGALQQIALHTRIIPGHEADYEREHERIPDELDPALREAGVAAWRIWRDGTDLFHVVEVEDYQAMRAHLQDHPANLRWQEHINHHLASPDSYEGGDEGIALVWELPAEPPTAATGLDEGRRA